MQAVTGHSNWREGLQPDQCRLMTIWRTCEVGRLRARPLLTTEVSPLRGVAPSADLCRCAGASTPNNSEPATEVRGLEARPETAEPPEGRRPWRLRLPDDAGGSVAGAMSSAGSGLRRHWVIS